MQTTSNYIYEHELISSELQNSLVNCGTHFIKINNQLHWIHIDSIRKLTITNIETNTNIIQIPLTQNIVKSHALLYDDNTLWIGIKSLIKYDEINNKIFPINKNSVFIFDLKSLTHSEFTIDFDIQTFAQIGNTYFTFKTQDELLVFNWNDLLKLNKQTLPCKTFSNETSLFPVNWRESSICKITYNSTHLEFMDEHFNTLFGLNIKDLFKNYKPIKELFNNSDQFEQIEQEIEEDDYMFYINDNCILFLEFRELIDEPRPYIGEGFKSIYCYDFTNNVEIPFKNEKILYYIHESIPYRYHGKVKYMSHEWYPAGSWISIYESLN